MLDAVDPENPRFHLESERSTRHLCEGLENLEIAKRLFISHSTVKVPDVHHVFDKLGIRSRTAVALNAANRRSYAAPATGDESTTSTSDG